MSIQTGIVFINNESDVITARKHIRDISTKIGFGITDTTRIVTATSELARNIILYAKEGQMEWQIINDHNIKGITLIFEDHGPGIPNIDQVLEGGYTSGNGLGLGVCGSKKLMDEMKIESTVGKGTKITISKWFRR